MYRFVEPLSVPRRLRRRRRGRHPPVPPQAYPERQADDSCRDRERQDRADDRGRDLRSLHERVPTTAQAGEEAEVGLVFAGGDEGDRDRRKRCEAGELLLTLQQRVELRLALS